MTEGDVIIAALYGSGNLLVCKVMAEVMHTVLVWYIFFLTLYIFSISLLV
jgi:hypothetical protein